MTKPAELISPVLPKDQYLHETGQYGSGEWWWHTGTLKCKKTNRLFGFEINAATIFTGKFIQVALIDIENDTYYNKVTDPLSVYLPPMAESDTSKDWWVDLPLKGANISMKASKDDVTNMDVISDFKDEKTGRMCHFHLNFRQIKGKQPLFVWGTGVKHVKDDHVDMLANNYYYSLTHLAATGTLQIEGEDPIEVEGITWMDHQYGAWGASVRWVLQNAILDNGVHLSTYTALDDGTKPAQNVPLKAVVTLLIDNVSTFIEDEVTLTPLGEPVSHAGGLVNYFMEYRLDIKNDKYPASITFRSLMKEQIFIWPDPTKNADIYEGIAEIAEGSSFGDKPVSGTAWTEQSIAY